MQRLLRRAWRPLAAGAVFAALAYPSNLLHLYAMRECYRFSELVGLMDSGGSLGGQIMGFNFQREPAWVHAPLRGVAASVGFAPALALSLAISSRLALGRAPTLCGRCGRELRDLERPECPSCRGGFG